MSNLSNACAITAYIHCALCIETVPAGQSPRTWAQLEVGWTPQGLQVWCRRHEANVLHIDFQGQQHPANVHRAPRAEEL